MRWIAIGAVIGTLLASSAWATDETNREIVRTFANYHIRNKDLKTGWQVLLDHLKVDTKDAEGWNLLGLLYLESKQNEIAIKAFTNATVITTEKDLQYGIFYYNLADALIRSGKTNEAKTALTLAAKTEAVSDAGNLAKGSLVPGSALAPLTLSQPGLWQGRAVFGVGYDTNVLLVSDSDIAGNTSTGASSPMATALAQATYQRPLWGGGLWGRLGSAFTYYSASEATDFNTLTTSLLTGWSKSVDEVAPFFDGFSNQFDLSYMNSNGFKFYNWIEKLRWYGGLRHSTRRTTGFEVPVGFQKYSTEEGDNENNDRTGITVAPTVSHSIKMGTQDYRLGLKLEKIFASGINYQSNAVALPLGWSLPVCCGINAAAQVEPSLIFYSNSSDSRKDKTLAASLALSKSSWGQGTSALSTTLEYAFRRNLSTVESAVYTKHNVTFWVSYDAF